MSDEKTLMDECCQEKPEPAVEAEKSPCETSTADEAAEQPAADPPDPKPEAGGEAPVE